jgi:hypothetical protein
MTPGIKWAYDYKNRVSGSKPVNFAELCSTKNVRESVFSDNRSKTVAGNGYFGVKCSCFGAAKQCGHASMLYEPNLINFVLKSAIDGKAAETSSSRRKFEFKSETYV